MSIRVLSDDPAALLARIKALIDKGHITTWEYDSDGDFTHTPSQWTRKAWLRPQIQSDKLRLKIVVRTESSLSREVFAVYHGRFIEMLMAHLPKRFSQATATASSANDEPSPS
jgi:hypothetical protein